MHILICIERDMCHHFMANRWGNNGNSNFIFLGSKITADDGCSHEIKRCLVLGRKAMTNLDSIIKSRDITLPNNVRLVKAMVFPVVMSGCESWTIKKAEHWRIDGFELWCWRRPLRVPWTPRRSNQSILKEISSVQFSCSVVSNSLWPHDRQHTRPPRPSVLNIHWKVWCWSWNSNTLATWCKELTHLKRPWC